MSRFVEGFINKIIEELGDPVGRFNLLLSGAILVYIYLCFFNKKSVFTNLIIQINVVLSMLILGVIALVGLLAFYIALNICYKALKAQNLLKG